jgi:hypothetical protein
MKKCGHCAAHECRLQVRAVLKEAIREESLRSAILLTPGRYAPIRRQAASRSICHLPGALSVTREQICTLFSKWDRLVRNRVTNVAKRQIRRTIVQFWAVKKDASLWNELPSSGFIADCCKLPDLYPPQKKKAPASAAKSRNYWLQKISDYFATMP